MPLARDCCAPLLREPLTPGQAADPARTLKALADPTRLRLVSMVAAHAGDEACVCDLTKPLGLTARHRLSQHSARACGRCAPRFRLGPVLPAAGRSLRAARP